jgi:N-carbamoyl-L-amino-acid hydrolase
VSFERMWAELARLGRNAGTGGYRRYAWTGAEQDCRDWFRSEASARGLDLDADGNGNEIAWWRPEPATGRPVVTGSHLDSVPDGGAFDGPLGVVSGLAAVDLLRERGITPLSPIGVAVFCDEEGARFGVACAGSRLLTGSLSADHAAALTDRDGMTLADAMRRAGFADELGPSTLLRDPAAFVELHVEQGRALIEPIGIATAIWPHGRWRLDITGEGNHAGTTRLADRRDPMLTYAETVLAVRKKAGQAGALATFGRVEVAPGGSNAIPSEVRAWLDARAPDEATLERLLAEITAHATARAGRDGTDLSVTPESVSPAVYFGGPLFDRVRAVLPAAPVLPTGAGHDAGVLATAGIPTAMLFVRNPTGISHAPAEFAEPADCLAGVVALADVLQELACR